MTPIRRVETFDTPVLLTVFNRPDLTEIVFESIRVMRPARLYVAADGPRPDVKTDAIRCRQTRDIVKKVDWPCTVQTLYRDRNLGCGGALSSALTWFFENEPEGIVLEDDCLPSQSFFWFCQELLGRYRDDTRIMHIGGNNFLNTDLAASRYSYYFSRNGHVWGWATWRRAWQTYDFRMKQYPVLKRRRYFDSVFSNRLERLYRLRKLDQVASGKIDTWDYQWDFARYCHSGLAIVPAINLVQNIGAGAGATHTKDNDDQYLGMKPYEITFPLRHPPFVFVDASADQRFFSTLMRNKVIQSLYKPMRGWRVSQ